MKKSKRYAVAKEGIIMRQETFIPEIVLKKKISKSFLKNIPASVIRAHLAFEQGFEDSPIVDPLLFFIPPMAKDPGLAACQLADAIMYYMHDVGNCSAIDKIDIDEFRELPESMDDDELGTVKSNEDKYSFYQ